MSARRYQTIPPGLDRMPPGAALAGFLSSIEVDEVSPHDRVVVLRAQQRMASHLQAKMWQAMAAIADHMDQELFADDPALAWEASATELRAALRLTRRSAESELDVAIGVRRLPRVWEALSNGDIDGRRARTILQGTSHLEPEAARTVAGMVIDDAPRLTTGELAARLRRLCVEADPDAAAHKYQDAVEGRRVVMEASPEGTAHLMGLDLPPERVVEISRRIDRLAKSLNRADDPRSIDQIRADIYLDLLAGAHRDAKGGIVDLQVGLDTLAGLSDAPGDLAGYGPVIADIARQLAEEGTAGEWRYTVVDPAGGHPVATGTTRRRPTAAEERSVESRDRTCIFPGCRMPARQCDLDHRTPWAEQRHTCAGCLAPGCRHDHVTVRHLLGWRYQLLPNGDYLWISPLGLEYTKSGMPP